MKLIKAAAIGTVLVFAVWLFGSSAMETMEEDRDRATVSTRTQAAKPEPEPKEIDRELQNKREAWIQRACDNGYFERFRLENGVGKVWVTPQFLALPEKDKNELLKVPFAYVMEELQSSVQFTTFVLKVDNGTELGRQIATYNPVNGIEIK